MMQLLSSLRSASSLIDDIPGVYVPQSDLETTITEIALRTVLIAASSMFVLTILAMLFSNKHEKLKMPLFVLMVIAMAGSTITLVGSTIYLNTNSDSGGPVHWHADFEFWACGNELEVRDPLGFSNKIGTWTLHEHDDHRIHLEGVVVDGEVDASLGKFMHVTGGAITESHLVLPLNETEDGPLFEDEEDGDGPSSTNPDLLASYIRDDAELGKVAVFKDGDTCGSEVADVQVFLYEYNEEDDTYSQRKLDNPRDYVITDDPNVPPGDCVIFEFGPEREKTDKLCEQYGIRDMDRCEEFGVSADQRAICHIKQVNYSSEMSLPLNTSETMSESEEILDEIDAASSEEAEPQVHEDPSIDALRVACNQTNDSSSSECMDYLSALDDNADAQSEAEALQNVGEEPQDLEGGN